MEAHIGNRARRVVCGAFYNDRHAVGGIALIHNLLVVFLSLRRCTLDGSLDPVFGHIRALGSLDGTPKLGVVVRVGTALPDGYGSFLSAAGTRLGHAVIPREGRVRPCLKYSPHDEVRLGETWALRLKLREFRPKCLLIVPGGDARSGMIACAHVHRHAASVRVFLSDYAPPNSR